MTNWLLVSIPPHNQDLQFSPTTTLINQIHWSVSLPPTPPKKEPLRYYNSISELWFSTSIRPPLLFRIFERNYDRQEHLELQFLHVHIRSPTPLLQVATGCNALQIHFNQKLRTDIFLNLPAGSLPSPDYPSDLYSHLSATPSVLTVPTLHHSIYFTTGYVILPVSRSKSYLPGQSMPSSSTGRQTSDVEPISSHDLPKSSSSPRLISSDSNSTIDVQESGALPRKKDQVTTLKKFKRLAYGPNYVQTSSYLFHISNPTSLN